MDSSKVIHYDPETDIAMICIESGHAVSEEHPWGLIDRDRETGKLMGFEIWNASSVLPREMVDALPSSNKPSGVAA
jgi:uncharacterized protein YuzE